MGDFVGRVLESVKDELPKQVGKKIAVFMAWLIGLAAISLWAYLDGVRPSVIALFAAYGLPVGTAGSY